MVKHIKIQAELIAPSFTRVYVKLLERSHYGGSFGPEGNNYKSYFTGSNGVTIYSQSDGSLLYKSHSLRFGFNGPVVPTNTLTLPITEYNGLKKCIEEYNAYYAEKE